MTTRFINSIGTKSLLAVSSLAVLLALGACGKKDGDDRTVGQKLDSAVAKTEQAATDAKNDVKAATTDASNSIKDATADAKTSMSNSTSNMSAKLDDAAITASVSAGLAKDSDLSAIKINVDTKDGVVTLNGPAPSVAAKDRATSIAQSVKGVSSVNNQLAVKSS